MTAEEIKYSIIQFGVFGQMNTGDESDESSELLIRRIKEERKKASKKEVKNNKYDSNDIPCDLPNKWQWSSIEYITYPVGEKKNQIKKSDIKNNGMIAVVSQSKELIDGYCNEENKKISDVPVIMFGDHTKNVKYIDFDFVIGADGTKFLKPILINSKFLFYALSLIAYKLPSRGYARHYSLLKKKPIPIPPLEEQERIVKRIEKILPLIDDYSKARHELDEIDKNIGVQLKKSILKYALTGKLQKDHSDCSATELLSEINTIRENKILSKEIKIDNNKKAKAIKEDELQFEIPNNWCWERFSNLCYFEAGKTPARADASNWQDGTIPWVTIADIVDGEPISTTKEKITQSAFENVFGAKLVEKDVLLMSFKLTIGKMAITTTPCVHNEAIINIKPYLVGEKLKIFQNYLLRIMPFIVKYGDFKNAVKGNTLNSKSISNLLIPVPPIKEQKQLIDKIDKILKLLAEMPK